MKILERKLGKNVRFHIMGGISNAKRIPRLWILPNYTEYFLTADFYSNRFLLNEDLSSGFGSQ